MPWLAALGPLPLLEQERWGGLCLSHKNENGDGVVPQRKIGVLV